MGYKYLKKIYIKLRKKLNFNNYIIIIFYLWVAFNGINMRRSNVGGEGVCQ